MPTLLQDKVFVFAGRPKPSDSELEILQLIADQENLGPILAAETIKNGENYDSYKLTIGTQNFLAKLSLDEKNNFGQESLILDKLSHLAPKKVCRGTLDFGDSIYYLITEWLDAQSLQEAGRSLIFESQDALLVSLAEVHKIDYPFTTFQEFLENLFKQTSFENQEQFELLVKTNSPNYLLLKEELLSAKEEIQKNFKEIYAAKTLIHGNLSENTILAGREGFKFINWENSFCAHPLFELAAAEMNFNLGSQLEFSLVQKMGESWELYLQIRDFWARVSLLKNVFGFIKEVYLYEGRRQKELLELVEKFYQNTKHYEKIEIFKKNREEILALFNQVAF